MEGKGKYFYANGDKFVGEFQNGKKNGLGIMYWGANSKFKGNRYEGEWKDDEMSGRGVYLCGNGGKYVGEMKRNQKDGFGI